MSVKWGFKKQSAFCVARERALRDLSDKSLDAKDRALKIWDKLLWATLPVSLGVFGVAAAIAVGAVAVDGVIRALMPFAGLAALLAPYGAIWLSSKARSQREGLKPLSAMGSAAIAEALELIQASEGARLWRDDAVASGRQLRSFDINAMRQIALSEQSERASFAQRRALALVHRDVF